MSEHGHGGGCCSLGRLLAAYARQDHIPLDEVITALQDAGWSVDQIAAALADAETVGAITEV